MSYSIIYELLSKFMSIRFNNSLNKEYEYKRTLYNTLKKSGGVYIKFLQILSTMYDFMNGWSGPKEYEVFNKVPFENIDLNRYIDINNFESICYEPFASGSFAQLYKGKLKSGEVVAIKVLRPSVERNLKKDLLELKRIVKIFSFFASSNMLDYNMAFNEFSSTCLLETDYINEVSNMNYFYNLYKSNSRIVIPKAYLNMSNEKVIVQDFIDGYTLADLMAKTDINNPLDKVTYDLTKSDIWSQIMVVGGEALRTAITADFVYGDPHPGNIMILPDDKIAFIDFGIVANKPLSQEAFYLWMKSYYDILVGGEDYGKLLESSYMCFCPDLINAFRRCSFENDFVNYIAKAINSKASLLYDKNDKMQNLIQNGHFIKMFTGFIDNKNALNIKLDMRNFQLLKAMQAFLSSITTIDNKDANNRFAKLMIGSMKYAFKYCDILGVKKDYSYNTKYSVNESYQVLVDAISSIAENDEFLFNSILKGMNS
ncbi:MAG: AarF/ABC1/UbiB kinase family protein [Bacilli bacterium]|nr:AarF/ABC1/UbiB kinase family protein [Bacilli bacterium]